MLETIFVYSSLSVIFIFLAHRDSEPKKSKYLILVPIAIYAIVFGMRYGVGADYFRYLESYMSGLFVDNRRWAPIFKYIATGCKAADLHFSVWFAICAFIPLVCVFLSVDKYKYIYPYLAFTFMLGGIWLSYSNGLRQIMAFGFFALTIPFLKEKKWLYYLIGVYLASLCHTSALILLPLPLFYIWRHQTYFNNVKLELSLLIMALLIGNINYIQSFMTTFDKLIVAMDYDYYTESGSVVKKDVNIGVGYYINLLIDIIIICFNRNAKKKLSNTTYPIIFDLAFVGILLKYAFTGVQLLNRINYYFDGFNYIAAAYTLYYLHSNKKYNYLYLLIGFFVLRYMAVLYRMNENTALFQFYWQIPAMY